MGVVFEWFERTIFDFTLRPLRNTLGMCLLYCPCMYICTKPDKDFHMIRNAGSIANPELRNFALTSINALEES